MSLLLVIVKLLKLFIIFIFIYSYPYGFTVIVNYINTTTATLLPIASNIENKNMTKPLWTRTSLKNTYRKSDQAIVRFLTAQVLLVKIHSSVCLQKLGYLDSNIPRNPAYGVYISQLVRYARIWSRKDDFIYRHRRLSLKLQQQGYKYQQLMKSFHKFYRSHSDELKKFGTTLMELLSSI